MSAKKTIRTQRGCSKKEGTFLLGNVLEEYMERLKKRALNKSFVVDEVIEGVMGGSFVFNLDKKVLYIYVPDNVSSFKATMKKEELISELRSRGLEVERISIVRDPSAYKKHPSEILREIVRRMLEKSYGSK